MTSWRPFDLTVNCTPRRTQPARAAHHQPAYGFHSASAALALIVTTLGPSTRSSDTNEDQIPKDDPPSCRGPSRATLTGRQTYTLTGSTDRASSTRSGVGDNLPHELLS